ncbi:zinc ribbon domain-containing protein [Actinomycetospora termitidis]|uniref:Zinc ribbon domain-containing protein n=1 Tax=Actinomycetospora termitidis TaxID=3053470 RepID=A0ABT7M179_9PSEU|nr:zinc ribbon domain-containing protein [Actinomycetospora sp. Odt1-22]MDL5154404.1 zinc ribbon domain-containing protein [Actinomycetospora sp. Odt1-22]
MPVSMAAGMAPVAPLPRRSNAPWIVAGIAVAVALLLVAIGVLATLRPAATTTVAVPTPVAAPTVTVGVPVASETSSGSSSPSYDSGSAAAATLQGYVEADRSTVNGLVGTWVPQLSAKHDGTVADGITYDDDAILSHFSSLAARYPSAALLWSGDWPVFQGDDYWVVVYPQSFATADAANAWCDAQGFAADDCLAKKLSHTGGPSGTTVPRS